MKMRTRIKLCGFTREEDVRDAVSAGADAIGMVFFSKSRRAVSIEQAKAIRAQVPAFVSVVALFVNPDPDYVREVIHEVSPDLLQFHGTESPGTCASFHKPYLKAFHIGAPGLETRQEVLDQCVRYGTASAWLFDSFSAGFGGSGQGFDVALLGGVINSPEARPIILAGGLTAANVAASIRLVRPYAVDVATGIEESPGIKSAEKMSEFVRAVQAIDNELA